MKLDSVDSTAFDRGELIGLFTKPLPSTTPKNLAQPQKVDKKELSINIDSKRSTELGIFLTKHPIDLNILIHSINTFTLASSIDSKFWLLLPEKFMTRNESSVSERTSEKDECDNFRKSGGSPEGLNLVSKFIYLMWTVPRLPERMKILLFKLEWETIRDESMENAQTVIETLKELESTTWKRILNYVLACENTLSNNQVKGFTITSLCKLRDIKSPTNKNMTIIHYLTGVMMKDGSILDWVDKLLTILKNTLPAVNMFQGVFPTILDNLVSIERELEASAATPGSDNSKYIANLTVLKKQVITDTSRLISERNRIAAKLSYLGSCKNDQPDDDAIRQIRSTWNKQKDIIPEESVNQRIQHDEEVYIFFSTLVSFFNDLKKAKNFIIESLKEKQKEKQEQPKAPFTIALKKRLEVPLKPEPSIMATNVPSKGMALGRKATIFKKTNAPHY